MRYYVRIIKEGSASTSLDVQAKDFNLEDTKRAIRQAIISEYDAVNIYTKIADSIEEEQIKKVLLNIAKEENVHIGELQKILLDIAPEELDAYEAGKTE